MNEPKILAVDDLEENLFILQELINRRMPQVYIISTTDPYSVFPLASREQPDTILLDVKMPGMSGIDLCKILKADPDTSRIPIILFTAHETTPRFKAEALEAGADDFLSKPIDNAELIAKINAMLRVRNSEEQLKEMNTNLESIVREKTKQLSENERRIRILLETIPYGIYECNLDLRFTLVNSAFERLTGYSRDELLERYIWDIMHTQEQKKNTIEYFNREKNEQSPPVPYFSQIVSKEMQVFDVRYDWSYIRDNNGTLYGYAVIVSDITLQKKSEEALETALVELEKKANRERIMIHQSRLAALGEMMGAIAHQWRQPLSTIGVIIQKLKLAFDIQKLDSQLMDKSAHEAMEQINYMSKTIDDFRNYFRPSRKKQTFSVTTAVTETISLMKAQLENNFIAIHVNCHPNALFKVWGYNNEFKQVLINIIHNARYAIIERREKGLLDKEAGDIYIHITGDKSVTTISIANNGGQIPHDVLPRIFDPFFSTREEGKGSGIGLYMSKNIIQDQMGGQIFAQNINEGVEFLIKLKNRGNDIG